MYQIDPTRTDLIEEFDRQPGGPHSAELKRAIMCLRTGPMTERFIVVCTRRGREWAVGRMPTERGKPIAFVEGAVFDDYDDAARLVFRLRWQAATGQALG